MITISCILCDNNPGEVCRGCHARQTAPSLQHEVSILLDEYNRLLRQLAESQAQAMALRNALRAMLDDRETCRIDHNGFCQNHYSLPPCPVGEARRLVGDDA